MTGRVLTVASGKGGVGKTTTAVNLAVALWTEGNAVAVVDADLGMANLAAVLGLEPAVTLHDVLAGRATVDEALVEAQDGDLLVLPGERSLAGFADADPNALQAVLAELADRCDFVVVDTGAGLSYEDVLPLGLADEVVLVTTPEPAAIGDTRKTLQLSGLLSGDVRGVVVTRTRADTDAGSVAAEIGVDLLGTVPEDSAVTRSTTEGQPLASHAPDAPATRAYARLASVIVGEAEPAEDSSEEGVRSADDVEESVDVDEVASGAEADPPAGETDAAADVEEPDEGPPEESTDVGDGEPEVSDEEEDASKGEPAEADESEAAGGDAAADQEEKRGGITGWLGRRFS